MKPNPNLNPCLLCDATGSILLGDTLATYHVISCPACVGAGRCPACTNPYDLRKELDWSSTPPCPFCNEHISAAILRGVNSMTAQIEPTL